MKSKIIRWLKILLPLMLGIFLMWWIYKKFTPEQLEKIRFHFQHAHYQYIYLSVILGFLSHLSRAYRWKYLLQPLGYTPTFYNTVMAVGVSYLMNMFIPRSGEVSRALVVKKYEHIPFEKAFGTIVAERIIDSIILMFLMLLAFFLQYQTLKDFVLNHIELYNITLIFIGLVLLFLIIIIYIKTSNSMLSKKIKHFSIGLKEGVLVILNMKKTRFFILHTVLIWSLYIAMFYVTIFALEETATISFGAVMTSFVIGSFTIIFTNGGFAYYPIFMAQLLVLFNVPYESGTAFGWMVWTSQFLMVLVFGGISFILLPVLNRKHSI